MKSSSSRVWSRLWLVLLVLSTLFFSSMPAQASGSLEKSPPGFRDGEWVGNFSMYTSAVTEVMKMKTSYKGEMGLISSGGQVNGEWTLSGTSTYVGDITGVAVFDGGGKVSGTSIEPVISTSKLVADMDVTVGGVHTQQSVDMGSGGNMSLTLISSTCSQVMADIEAPVKSSYQQAGMTASVSGSFVATRVADLKGANVTEYQKQVGDLLDEAEALKQKAIDNNGIDFEALNQVVSKAENLEIAITKNAECGQGADKQFLTLITGTVIDLAYFALSKPELFTTGELNRLLMAAIGVGAMGSGAANSQIAADLSAKFTQEFTDRLNDAETNKNCMEATQILLAAGVLKNTALKQQADSVMTAAC
ncbi:MAG TPA: hypothetical protein VK206_07595 [Anaerolineales bacterium]|nr:hypothetical protein [Anaerolineales bacterium]